MKNQYIRNNKRFGISYLVETWLQTDNNQKHITDIFLEKCNELKIQLMGHVFKDQVGFELKMVHKNQVIINSDDNHHHGDVSGPAPIIKTNFHFICSECRVTAGTWHCMRRQLKLNKTLYLSTVIPIIYESCPRWNTLA